MAISRRSLLGRLGAGAVAAVAAPQTARNAFSAPLDAAAPDATHSGLPIRLHRNESRHGSSPKVVATIRDVEAHAAGRYPDVEAEALRHRIGGLHGVAPDQVVLGCGSVELLRVAIDAFSGPQKTILAARPTFELIGQYARRAGAEVVGVPLSSEYAHDVSAMLARVDAATAMVYICNPNNHTGTLTPRQDLERLLRELPANVHVLIDEAYHHYVGSSADYASFIDRPVDDHRVIVTRSFSTIHGLAGLRVGYAVAASQTAYTLASQRLSDSVNVVAARAAAAAIDDAEYVRASVSRTDDDRQEFLNQANARMLRSIDSLTNFVMLHTGRPTVEVVQHLGKHGILVSGPVPAFDSYIRVSMGTPAEMREFWRVWDLMPGGHTMVM